jgi:small-conductance mechanosensitive channel
LLDEIIVGNSFRHVNVPMPPWTIGRLWRRWSTWLCLAVSISLLLGLVPHPAHSTVRPAWVSLDGQPVLEIRVATGAQSPADLAERIGRELRRLAQDSRIAPEQLVVQEEPPYWMVVQRQADGTSLPRLAVDERSARSFGISQQALAEQYRDQLRAAIRQYRNRHRPMAWLSGTLLALLLLVAYASWLRWQVRIYRRLTRLLRRRDGGLTVGGYALLDGDQCRQALSLGLTVLHWSLLLLGSYLLIPLLLGRFPPTQVLAAGLRGQTLSVLSLAGRQVLEAIPALLTIALIMAVTALLVRVSNAWFRAIGHGRVRLPGFYPEWASPTARLVALGLVIGGLVAAFPFIPGSGTRSFQGAGLFVGLLAALGSSAVATNVISGLMLIYTRSFQEGDWVEINGVMGVVQDRALLVTRIQTPRNELVSIPNASVIGGSITNYSFSRREIQQPVALATTVTIGYDVDWRRVHALLLDAAGSVAGVSASPEPSVLQTALNDFHVSYELNAFVEAVSRYRETRSDLLAAIQDRFAAAEVEILSPGYHAIRDGNPRTLPG